MDKHKILSFFTFALVCLSTAHAGSSIPPGEYMELYSGSKMGGPSYHDELRKELKKDAKLDGFAFFCVKGRSRDEKSNSGAYAVDREKRLPPLLAKSCKGSAAILMGPVQGENLPALKDHLEQNYMHLYMSQRTVQ